MHHLYCIALYPNLLPAFHGVLGMVEQHVPAAFSELNTSYNCMALILKLKVSNKMFFCKAFVRHVLWSYLS